MSALNATNTTAVLHASQLAILKSNTVVYVYLQQPTHGHSGGSSAAGATMPPGRPLTPQVLTSAGSTQPQLAGTNNGAVVGYNQVCASVVLPKSYLCCKLPC